MATPDGSVYDAIYLAIADREGVPFEEVKEALLHREAWGDYFWSAWDHTVSDAASLFCRVTNREQKEEVI